MERRSETRFAITSKVKVTLLSSLDRQIDCRMVDISATGMRFIADEALPEGEMVAVDFEDHLAVATIRHSQAYGDKYSIGTSRIHSLPKDQLPAGEPQYQQIRALLEEKGWSVEIETSDPASYAVDPVTQPEPAPAPETPKAESPAAESPAAEPKAVPNPEPVAEPKSQVAPPLAAPIAMPPIEPPILQTAPASSRGWVAIAAGLLFAVALVVYLQHLRRPAPVYSAPAAAAAAIPVTAPEPPTPEPVVAPNPAGNLHRVRFTVLERTWVSASADGKLTFAKTLEPGDTPEVEFSKIAYVHIGNYHGVAMSLDGAATPELTGAGALRLIEVTPSGLRTLPWRNGDPVPAN